MAPAKMTFRMSSEGFPTRGPRQARPSDPSEHRDPGRPRVLSAPLLRLLLACPASAPKDARGRRRDWNWAATGRRRRKATVPVSGVTQSPIPGAPPVRDRHDAHIKDQSESFPSGVLWPRAPLPDAIHQRQQKFPRRNSVTKFETRRATPTDSGRSTLGRRGSDRGVVSLAPDHLAPRREDHFPRSAPPPVASQARRNSHQHVA